MPDIEIIGTSTVKLALSTADYLKTYINENEKGPSFDGYICAYSNIRKSNKDEKGRAPVQIKGREVIASELLRESISYPVDVSDLIIFRREGGVIFFAVLIEKENPSNTKIYYNSLLPYDLNDILAGKETQDKISIHLKAFPMGKEMEDVVLRFVQDRIKQFSIITNEKFKNFSIDDIIKSRGSNAPMLFNVGYTSVKKSDDCRQFSYFFDHDFFIYYKNDPFDSMIPMQHVSHLKIVQTETGCSLKVKDTEFFNRCHVMSFKDKSVYSFEKNQTSDLKSNTKIAIQNAGKNNAPIKLFDKPIDGLEKKKYGFTITRFEKKDESGRIRTTLNFRIIGNLDERINIEQFTIAMYEEKSYTLNGKKFPVMLSKGDTESFNIKKHQDYLRFLLDARETLKNIGCTDTLDFDSMSENDTIRLRCLIKSVLYKKTIAYKSPVIEVTIYQVANLHLLIYFEKNASGRYLLKKIPSENLVCHTEDETGSHLTSFYTILTAENFELISNLNLQNVVDSICSFENASHYQRANISLLEILTAYDKTERIVLLDAAQKIAKWLVSRDENDKTMGIINVHQCLKRRKLFGDNEAKLVRNLIRMNPHSPDILAGCYLLLDDSKMAKENIQLIEKDKRKYFLTYPIMKFMDPEIRKELLQLKSDN